MTIVIKQPARKQELRQLYSQLVHTSQDEGYTEEALKTVKRRDKKRFKDHLDSLKKQEAELLQKINELEKS